LKCRHDEKDTCFSEPKATIRALGASAGQISKVEMLGCNKPLKWEWTVQGLVVSLPAEKPSHFACGLKITGANQHPAQHHQ